MKRIKIATLLLGFVFLFNQCTEDDTLDKSSNEGLPQKFTVDIPSSLSNVESRKMASTGEFSGADTYEHLRSFIALGEMGAEFIEEIMIGIATYGLYNPMDITFISDDDGRDKHLVVVDDVTFENKSYDHMVSMSDLASESNPDKGLAMQVFWNDNPVEGIAILKPYNWDRIHDEQIPNTILRIDYSETGEYGYDASMIVSIADWEYDNSFDQFAIDNLKMFVGKNGDNIDVYGNSNHPNAWLFMDDTTGLSWAFVASGSENSNIGVAEVGLPWSFVNSDSRKVILEDYSIKNVFTMQINRWFKETYGIEPDATQLSALLQETEAPGFFNSAGFVSGGALPSSEYQPYVDNINDLTPYNPYEIANLKIRFK